MQAVRNELQLCLQYIQYIVCAGFNNAYKIAIQMLNWKQYKNSMAASLRLFAAVNILMLCVLPLTSYCQKYCFEASTEDIIALLKITFACLLSISHRSTTWLSLVCCVFSDAMVCCIHWLHYKVTSFIFHSHSDTNLRIDLVFCCWDLECHPMPPLSIRVGAIEFYQWW